MHSEICARISVALAGFIGIVLALQHQYKQRSIRANTPTQLAITLLSFPVAGVKLAVGLGFLLAYAYEFYYLGSLWMVGVSAYLFAMILFDNPRVDDEKLA
jgi:hypothetical protein